MPDCRRSGFTLLEMVMVMFILSLLIGSVFGIVRGVTQLTNAMTVEQQRDARTHGFVELCSRTFRSLPPNAMIRLRTKQAGNHYLSQLALVGATSPVSGNAGGVTVLETEEAPDGYLRVQMRAMTTAEALLWEKGDTAAGLRLMLLENVAKLDWKFFNPENGEWEPLWNDKVDFSAPGPAAPSGDPAEIASVGAARRPGLIELNLAFGAEPPQRHVFWAPPSEPVVPLNSAPSPTDPAGGMPLPPPVIVPPPSS